MNQGVKFLGQKESQELDQELMSTEGFFSEQLMELAGLSVASIIAHIYPLQRYSKLLVICGPGNNGGDGMIASRHLKHFGYEPHIFYPKRVDKPLFKGLVTQCSKLEIPFLSDLPANFESEYSLIVDAIFGYSFSGDIRPPFDTIIKKLKESKLEITSVDVPSGWDIEKGNIDNRSFIPHSLISLTAPKICAHNFHGLHYLGGRFISPLINKKYGLNLPSFEGTSQFVQIK